MRELLGVLQEKARYYDEMKQKAMKSLANNNQEGGLRVAKSHGSFQYYLCEEKGDTKGIYLSKDKRSVAEQIAQRDYDRQVIRLATQWQHWLEQTMGTMPQQKLADIYNKSLGRKQLILPYEISDQEYVKHWQSKSYEGKPFAPESPEIYSERGERVRSKSEKMIADKLFMLGIPYRYEYPVYLKGFGTVYPDFLLLDIATREEMILEHFGMMDHPEYANKATRKINLYMKNGYAYGKSFIATFETTDTPLDMRLFEKMVRAYLEE